MKGSSTVGGERNRGREYRVGFVEKNSTFAKNLSSSIQNSEKVAGFILFPAEYSPFRWFMNDAGKNLYRFFKSIKTNRVSFRLLTCSIIRCSSPANTTVKICTAVSQIFNRFIIYMGNNIANPATRPTPPPRRGRSEIRKRRQSPPANFLRIIHPLSAREFPGPVF